MVERIAEQYGIDLNDMDSLAQMTLVMALEHELGINFTMSQIVSMKTVRDIVEAVNECIKNKSGGR